MIRVVLKGHGCDYPTIRLSGWFLRVMDVIPHPVIRVVLKGYGCDSPSGYQGVLKGHECDYPTIRLSGWFLRVMDVILHPPPQTTFFGETSGYLRCMTAVLELLEIVE